MKGLSIPKNYLLVGSLIGLLSGLLIGVFAKMYEIEVLFSLSAMLEPLGTLWINALRMLVLPLIIAYIITAVASFSEVGSTFKIGGKAIFAHLTYLLLGLALMITIVPNIVTYFEVTDEITQALQNHSVEIPASAEEGESVEGYSDAIGYILPNNIIQAAYNEDILPLMIATLLFALALIKVPENTRNSIVDLFKAIVETLHVLIGWILMVMPFAVFILVFAMATEAGLDLFSALLFFVLLFCGLLILLTLFLYVVTPILGGVSLNRFARSAAPAQIMAVGTRSSIVCLPVLIEGARDRLKLPESVVGLVMPLAVSMFKINKAVSGPIQVFFLAHLYGIQLEPFAIAMFFLAYVPLSFSSPGIPSGGFFVSLPLYMALGIPVEGVVILRTVDAIPDIFKTVANVTEDISVTALVARFTTGSETITDLPETVYPE